MRPGHAQTWTVRLKGSLSSRGIVAEGFTDRFSAQEAADAYEREHVKPQFKTPTQTRPELSFDGKGINGPDEYRERVATFRNDEGARKYGPLFAAAPDLLAALQALSSTARTFRNVPKEEQDWGPLDDEALEAAFDAIAKATGEGA